MNNIGSEVFSEDQLPFLTVSISSRGKNAPSLFDDLTQKGQWKFLANFERTEAAVKHDSRPTAPCRLLKLGRKFSTRKLQMKEYKGRQNVDGLALSCVKDEHSRL